MAVVIAAGPASDPSDTVESVLRYCPTAVTIVVVDDTGGRLGWQHLPKASAVSIIPAPPGAAGGLGGLYVKVVAGLAAVLSQSSVDIVVKMDVDALVIGEGLAEIVGPLFAGDPTLGILGSYTTGPTGGRRNWGPAERTLRHEMGVRGLRHPSLRSALRRTRTVARSLGYVDGEHVLGGAYVMRRELVQDLCARPDLTGSPWQQSQLGEDHLMGLMAISLGYRLGDLSGMSDPLSVAWRGLSADPEELIAGGKLMVHSVDYSPTQDERGVREIFRRHRDQP